MLKRNNKQSRYLLILAANLLAFSWCSALIAQTSVQPRVIEVPFDFVKNEIVLRVSVNEKGPFQMMLDTGTDPSAVDLAAAKEMGLKLDPVGQQGSGGGKGVNLIYETQAAGLSVGALMARNVSAVAIDLSQITERLGIHVHGILGHSFLDGRIVQIDYPRRMVRFYAKTPPVSANRPGTPMRTTLAFRYADGIIVNADVNGRKLAAEIDTGSDGTFKLTPAAVTELGLDEEVRNAPISTSVGYNGAAENREGKLKSVALGNISAESPNVVFFGKGTGRDHKPWGLNIGNAFLKDFVVTINYLTNSITLERP
jgi:predicted aspartyl protease